MLRTINAPLVRTDYGLIDTLTRITESVVKTRLSIPKFAVVDPGMNVGLKLVGLLSRY